MDRRYIGGMFPGPLFAVELITTGRRRRYFALRVAYAALLLLVLATVYKGSSRRFGAGEAVSIHEAAAVASTCFVAFGWVQLLGLMLVAPAIAVGVISTERERRTIEYLFVSDLSNAEIVVGKTLARLLLMGKLLLVGLPIMLLLRLLGGVPASLVVASLLIVCVTTLLITSISICVSVGSARARDATVRVYLVLAALFLLPLFLDFFRRISGLRLGSWISAPIEFLVRINPIYVFGESLGSASALGAGLDLTRVWELVAWHLGLAAAGLLLATLAVRRVHLRESTRGGVVRGEKKLWGGRRWRPALGDQPVLWKEAFSGGARTRLGWAGAVALLLLVAAIFGLTGAMFWQAVTQVGTWRNDLYFQFLGPLTTVVGTASLLLLALRGAGLATQEKERDTWLSLLATPLTAHQIVRGKILGNMFAARWSALLLAMLSATGMAFLPMHGFSLLLSLAVFAVLAWVVSNVGLLFSLSSATTLRAMGLTLATTLTVGGGYLFCCCILAPRASDDSMAVMLPPCVPFLLAFPTIWIHENIGRNEASFVTAFFAGLIGYAVLGVVLYLTAIANFDASTGRCVASAETPNA